MRLKKIYESWVKMVENFRGNLEEILGRLSVKFEKILYNFCKFKMKSIKILSIVSWKFGENEKKFWDNFG